MLPGFYAVDEAATWRESYRSYLGRSHRRKSVVTTNCEKSAEAIVQVLTPLYEVQFSETSYGFRPNKSAHRAIYELKRLSDEGYSYATSIDIKSYFDTLNHNLLLEIVRRTVKDKELVGLIKKYLKAGVLENGVVIKTDKGSKGVYYHRFKFLGFTLGKRKDTTEIRIHKSAVTKAKQKLRELTKRNRGKNVRAVMGRT